MNFNFDQLPKVDKPIEEMLLGGYYRIDHTDDLIDDALAESKTPEDKRFWSDAKNEERGHADQYRADLIKLWGRTKFEQLLKEYRPCPAIVDLMTWLKHDLLHLAVYRAYMENFLVQMPDAARQELMKLLPTTGKTHFDADPHHVKDCEQYLKRYDAQEVERCIRIIEKALIAESQWRGLDIPPDPA